MEVIYEKDLDFIRPIECIYQYKNAFILYTMQSGKLWKWSHKTKKYIEIADMEEEYQTWLFVTCIEVDEVLYFVPYLAKYMIEYHLKTGKIDRVFLRSNPTEVMYHKAVHYNGRIFLFPVIGDEILIYEIANKKKTIWKAGLIDGRRNNAFILSVYIKNHKAWGVTGKDSKVYCYDLDQVQANIFEVAEQNSLFIDITSEKKEMFILTDDGVVLVWDMQDKIERIASCFDEKIHEPYFAIHYSLGLLWLIPKNVNCVRAINLQGEMIEEWDFSNLRTKNGLLFEGVVQQGDMLFLCSYSREGLVIIDTKKHSVEIKYMQFDLAQKIDILWNLNDGSLNRSRMIGTHIWKELKRV